MQDRDSHEKTIRSFDESFLFYIKILYIDYSLDLFTVRCLFEEERIKNVGDIPSAGLSFLYEQSVSHSL